MVDSYAMAHGDGVDNPNLEQQPTAQVNQGGGADNPDLEQQQITQVAGGVEVHHHPRRGRLWWLFLSAGVIFILTAISQITLAGVIRSKGIHVIEHWFAGNLYPTAGDIGLSPFFIAIYFTGVMVYERRNNGRLCRPGCFAPWGFVLFVFSFTYSFGEIAVYNKLSEYDECMDNVDGNYTVNTDGGDCYCWNYDVGGGDDKDNIDLIDSGVNVDIAAGMSCDRILDYLDDILASYILWIVLLVLVLVVICLDVRAMVAQATIRQPAVTVLTTPVSRTVATVNVVPQSASQRPMLTTRD